MKMVTTFTSPWFYSRSMHLSGLLLGQHSCVLPPTKGKWEEHSLTLCWQFFYFLRLENTLPLVVGINVLQQLRYWFSRLRWSNFISINGIFQQYQMNICISHNGLGKKSQNVILWKCSHCLFFVNTVILIEIQLPHFPAEKATCFWNIFFLVLKNKQQTSEWKSYYFHFFNWTNIPAYCALRKGMKDWLLQAQMFLRTLLDICYKSCWW